MRTVAISAALLLTLTACGGGDEKSEPQEPVTVTQTVEVPTPTSDPTEAAPTEDANFEPNVGDRALKVGQPRVGRALTTVLLEVRDPYPPEEFKEPEPGARFVGLRISQCVRDDADPSETIYGSYNGEWVAVTSDNDEYPGSGNSFTDFPRPKFPENATIPVGSCVKGWLTVELPEKIRYSKFVWRSAGDTLAEWLIK